LFFTQAWRKNVHHGHIAKKPSGSKRLFRIRQEKTVPRTVISGAGWTFLVPVFSANTTGAAAASLTK
jgi:hypothetical protein